MKVVILCGGQGTRLREETEYRPKPLVPVGGRPILWHIMRRYIQSGFNDFVLCLGYRGNLIKQYFLDYEAMSQDFTLQFGPAGRKLQLHGQNCLPPFAVTLAETGEEAMTGARIKRAAHYLDGDCFMVTYGDGLSDLDLGALLRFHQAHGKLATITSVHPVSRYGELRLAEDGQVQEFKEKPPSLGWSSAGFFVFQRPVLDFLRTENDCVLEKEPLERLARDGQLVAYRHDGFFQAMDTYREYLYLNDLWNRGRAPWRTWEE